MSKRGPILVVEDDADDQHILIEISKRLKIKNKIKIFGNVLDAIDFLNVTKEHPFLILCDISMPMINGLEFRQMINNDKKLSAKKIPFIYLSSAIVPKRIDSAYQLTVQGFFEKDFSYEDLEDTFKAIFTYWSECKHPSDN